MFSTIITIVIIVVILYILFWSVLIDVLKGFLLLLIFQSSFSGRFSDFFLRLDCLSVVFGWWLRYSDFNKVQKLKEL